MKSTAIVLAAGTGKRMGSKTPKQYLEINGFPIIYYTLKAFEESLVDEVILVTSKSDISYCKESIVERYGFTKVKYIVSGGKERYDSVFEGLKKADSDYVLVHDGARPFISADAIKKLLSEVKSERACVAAVPVKDTIKIADESGYAESTPDRSTLWTIQTPQVFETSLLKEAYERMYQEMDESINITDDAMVVENYTDIQVKLVKGEYTNIKVTTPEDMVIAKAFLENVEEMNN